MTSGQDGDSRGQIGLPYVAGSDTSKAAGESMAKAAPTLRARVLRTIRNHGNLGATDDQLEWLLHLPHQTISARRRELVIAGLVVDTGKRRKTRSGRKATVWRCAEIPGPVAPPKPRKPARPSRADLVGAAAEIGRLYAAAGLEPSPEARRLITWISRLEEVARGQ